MNVTSIKKRQKKGQIRGRTVDPTALAEVWELLGDEPRRRDLLIEHLHRIQDRFHCLPATHLVALAEEMRLATTEVYEIATFYHHFDVVKEGEAPPPPLTVRVCDSVTCELFGARELLWRGVGHDRVHRGQARHAAVEAALSGPGRALRPAVSR